MAELLVPTLETGRLIIRPLVLDDLQDCHRLYVDIDWADKDASDVEKLAQRRQWLDWTVRNYEQLSRLSQPPYGDRAVVVRHSGRFAGLVGLVPLLAPFAQLPCFGKIEHAPFSAEVGLFWALSPAMQGQGFATEAARALINFAFQTLRLGRIMAGTEYENAPSIAVMSRLGMRIEKNPFPDPEWFQVTGILEARPPR